MKYPIENAIDAAMPPIIKVCNDVLTLFFSVTAPLNQPTINKATPVSIIEYKNWFFISIAEFVNAARTKDRSGINPITKNEKNVTVAFLLASVSFLPFKSSSDFSERYFETAIEKPSANKFANPKIKIIEEFSDAPTTPDTTAKVVIAPSIPP